MSGIVIERRKIKFCIFTCIFINSVSKRIMSNVLQFLKELEIEKKINSNLHILDLVKNYLLVYPECRFTQALSNLNINKKDENGCIIDNYYVTNEDLIRELESQIITIE